MQKKIPLWPLYLADILILVCVGLIVLPNIILKEPLGDLQSAFLLIAVLFASLLVLLPYVLNYKLELQLEKDSAKYDYAKLAGALDVLASDIRSLRTNLAVQSEKEENFELAVKNSFEKVKEEFKNTKTEVYNDDDLRQSIFALQATLNEVLDSLGESDPALEGIQDQLKSLDSFTNQLKIDFDEFKNSLEIVEQYVEEDADEESDDIKEDEAQESSANEENQFFGGAEDIRAAENFEELAEEEMQEALEEAEEDTKEEEEQEAENFDEDSEEERAQEGIESEEFYNDNLAENSEDDEAYLDASDGQGIESSDEIPEPEFAENTEENFAAEEKSAYAKNWAGLIDKALQNSQTDSTKDLVSRMAGAKGEAAPEQAALFGADEIPEHEKPKAAKRGETAVIVNAFIGLGNKPYIRGNCAGLSWDKGVALEMLEIGKWQWKCQDLNAQKIEFTILLNDETPSNLGALILNADETLELNPQF